MNAGRELDALVAEKVFGWEVDWAVPTYPTVDMKRISDDPVAVGLRTGSIPPYSTDIAAAWQVGESLSAKGHWFEIRRRPDGGYWAAFGEGMSAEADTAPLAICLAALKAVE